MPTKRAKNPISKTMADVIGPIVAAVQVAKNTAEQGGGRISPPPSTPSPFATTPGRRIRHSSLAGYAREQDSPVPVSYVDRDRPLDDQNTGAAYYKPDRREIIFGAPWFNAASGTQELQATLGHEIGHAEHDADFMRANPIDPKAISQFQRHVPSAEHHGAGFRPYERRNLAKLGLEPEYSGEDYEGEDRYPDRLSFTTEPSEYEPHVYVSNYADPRSGLSYTREEDLPRELKRSERQRQDYYRHPSPMRGMVRPA